MSLGLDTVSIGAIKDADVTRILSRGGAFGGRVIPFREGQDTDGFGGLGAGEAPYVDLNVSTLEDVFLLVGPGRDGVVFDAEGTPIEETLAYADVRLHGYHRDRLRRDAVPIAEPLFLAFDPSWRNYYHWTIIGLGRAMLYNRYCGHENAAIVFDRKGREEAGWSLGFAHDVWRDGLSRSGVVENCVFLKSGLYRLRRLDVMWMRNAIGQSVNHPPIISYFPELYGAFRRLSKAAAAAGTRNVIISRPHDPRLSHEAAKALQRLAETTDFRFVTLENLRFDEQLDLFAAARCVVAPHGAGLTNLVYAPASTHVVELNQRVLNETTLRPWFYLTAAGMDQSYSFVDLDREQADAESLYSGLLACAQGHR